MTQLEKRKENIEKIDLQLKDIINLLENKEDGLIEFFNENLLLSLLNKKKVDNLMKNMNTMDIKAGQLQEDLKSLDEQSFEYLKEDFQGLNVDFEKEKMINPTYAKKVLNKILETYKNVQTKTQMMLKEIEQQIK